MTNRVVVDSDTSDTPVDTMLVDVCDSVVVSTVDSIDVSVEYVVIEAISVDVGDESRNDVLLGSSVDDDGMNVEVSIGTSVVDSEKLVTYSVE